MSYVLVTRNETQDEMQNVNSRRFDRPLGFVTRRKIKTGMPKMAFFKRLLYKSKEFDLN